MEKLSPYYIVINIKDGTVRLVETKAQVADIIGCHPNTLAKVKDRTALKSYIIIPTYIERVKRKQQQHNRKRI